MLLTASDATSSSRLEAGCASDRSGNYTNRSVMHRRGFLSAMAHMRGRGACAIAERKPRLPV